MEKYSILMLMSVYHEVSGHTRVVDALCIELNKMGHNVTLGSFNFKKDPPKQISKLELTRTNITKKINEGKFDIIHNHQTLMNYHLLFVKHPIIFHYHGASSKLQKINLKIASVICNKKIGKIISISESAKKEIKEYFPTKPNSVIYNGVNTTFYKNSNLKKNKNLQLLFVGNLFKYKNIQFLIKNFLELKNEFPNIHLQIIGDGEYRESIVKIIDELNLNKNIQLLGRVNDEDLIKYYSKCDIYFTASTWEFFNLPLLESMSCGKPILVSELPVHREIILKSNAGEIFEMNMVNLIGKMHNILKNYDQFSQNARKFALENDWSYVAKRISSVYSELI
jgi:glycosyltransferase involved in cell wall biosynthesis